jgi:L-arabinokinase
VLAYYITAHGYGHGTRSCDILRALLEIRPGLPITIVSDLDPAFLQARLPARRNVLMRTGSFDIGMVQVDSVRVDLDATLARGHELLAKREALVAQERAFLRGAGAKAVVADIPAIPLEAAAAQNIPAVAVGNFGWDWIYEDYAARDPRWSGLASAFAGGYARADLVLRLPFAEPMRAFRKIEDVPLVARPGRNRRDEIAKLSGADPTSRWSLLSFTSLDWTSEALNRAASLDGHEFFTVLPLAWKHPRFHAIDRRQVPYADVMASVDVVISKPGFGVLSECAVNDKPLVYAERTDFREYAVLVDGLKKVLRNVHIPSADLYRGELGPALEAIRLAPEPREKIEAGGDVVAARKILTLMEA